MHEYRSTNGERRLWFSEEEIEDRIEEQLRRASLFPTIADPMVDLEEFLEFALQVKLDLYSPLESEVLGVTNFVRRGRPQVSINSDLTSKADSEGASTAARGRWRATLAHEASHVIFHRRLYEVPSEQGMLFDIGEPELPGLMRCLARDVSFGRATSDWREVQANLGMASLLMPAKVFFGVARAVVGIDEFGEILPLVPRSESSGFHDFVNELALRCGVSRQAARIRLGTLGLVWELEGPMLGRTTSLSTV